MSTRRSMRPFWAVAGASAWMATAGNIVLWSEMRSLDLMRGVAGWASAAALAALVGACLVALLSLLAWRWTLKPVLTLMLITSAAGTFFMLEYGVVIDSGMIVSVLQTDAREASDLVSWRLLAYLAVLGLLPAAWLWRTPVDHAALPGQALRNLAVVAAALAFAVGVALLNFQSLSSSMRNHKHLRYLINPLNTVYALGRSAIRPARGSGSTKVLGADAHAPAAGARPPLVVLVLGETARSGNFGLNGYGRATTPELARENVASARRVTACGTSTAASLPCMFSHLGRSGFESRADEHENLLDVLQHAGLAVLWIDNQSGCKGVCERVAQANTASAAHPRLCPGGQCFDEIMLEGLDERLQALPAQQVARGVVVIAHQMGSHGPAYHLRSPPAFKRFLPECASAGLQDCSREEVVNAYDNSIAYTDHFVASTIQWLKQRETSFDTAMVYVADHGESLGENNLYLHGMPWSIAPDLQKQVPWITWLSAGFERRNGLATECLRQQQDVPLSHDNYFHSVLGLLQVSTAAYDRGLDAYAACAGH